ncbi:hypothetical protein DC366_12665 [Pelagivirga sediminicola]|uniref:SCO family protein n=1 Tax=Pelagivirga sediminicola TaxID=2170575 RepID=A0A2T7G542_9RHOB|nr:SCO family protein [Pelagivirga sediminicola]PVA09548.1 hypothetical protein DC366_12665 [Pelagivirga sediminicola]
MKRFLLCLAICATPALAHDGKVHTAPEGAGLDTVFEEASVAVSDAPLLDQFGNVTTLAEAVGHGPFVLSFTYTDCESLCGLADMVLGGLLARPDRPADLRIITLTLDPANDRPKELLERHEAFGAPDNWIRLTGAPSDVIPLLSRNGAWDGGPIDEHRLVMIVSAGGNDNATRVNDRSFDLERIVRLLSPGS